MSDTSRDTARGSCAVPTPAEALATVRQALAVLLAREEAAHACPTCCVAVFFRNGEPGSDPQPGEELWRPGLVLTEAQRDWLRAVVRWRQGGEVGVLPPCPVPLYAPCPDCLDHPGRRPGVPPVAQALAVLTTLVPP